MILNKKCIHCNKEFIRSLSPSEIKKRKGKYCSRKCASEDWKEKYQKGKITPFWKGLEMGRYNRKGKKASIETRRKISLSLIGSARHTKSHSVTTKEKLRKLSKKQWKNPEYRKIMNPVLKANQLKAGKVLKQKWADPKFREKMMKKMWRGGTSTKTKICQFCKKEFVTKNFRNGRGKYCSLSCSGKSKWQNQEYREKTIRAQLKGLFKRPTSIEKQMIGIIQKYNLPYKYTGDGSFLIGFKNPDFVNVNGEKKLIEVGNVFHHQGDYVKKRREHFAKYGWKSYIFIQDKLDENAILREISSEYYV